MKKYLLYVVLLSVTTGCAAIRQRSPGCGDWRDVERHNGKPFRVERIKSDSKEGNYIVTLRSVGPRLGGSVVEKYRVWIVPDSVVVGTIVKL